MIIKINENSKELLAKAVAMYRGSTAARLPSIKSEETRIKTELTLNELINLEATIAAATESRKGPRGPNKNPRNTIGIYETSRGPIMNSNKGRHWVTAKLVLQDGTETTAWFDTVYGVRFFWENEGKWWCAKISEFNVTEDDVARFDLRSRQR